MVLPISGVVDAYVPKGIDVRREFGDKVYNLGRTRHVLKIARKTVA
jgi:hypothetical protein